MKCNVSCERESNVDNVRKFIDHKNIDTSDVSLRSTFQV